ncbi:MAG: pyruvate formate lyase activating enzyme [Bacillota bacterium]|nr:pyruvate formate lyase activating enzyme [Bacillota bacterium]MDK2882819.1 pyruvate formate lyase activating enzyme [Bacillota bacterium]MDK2960522.1 pyruvate formate lyase activating enzyme [Bacillota bacterium]
MGVKGVQPVSLVDYPGHICSTVFFGGCNFRCPFCHNAGLVERADTLPDENLEDVLAFLTERRHLVPAVCITGGEPTLAPELTGFIRRLKRAGLLVKLDTNGTRPEVLRALLAERLLDYVAMDVKAPPDKYGLLTGRPVDLEAIHRSINLIRTAAPAYEFRTTVVPELLTEKDILDIGRELAGSDKYVLQPFRPAHPLIDPQLELAAPCPVSFLEKVAKELRALIKTVEVRG